MAATNWAWTIRGLTQAEGKVLLRLAWRCPADDWVVSLAVGELAADCDQAIRTVRDALRTLEERGLLSTEQRPGRRNRYWLPRQNLPGGAAKSAGVAEREPRQNLPPQRLQDICKDQRASASVDNGRNGAHFSAGSGWIQDWSDGR